MIQDRFHISASDAREPFEELINRRTITQVLKQSSYWNASAAKHKCSADFVMVSFDCIEIVPVSIQFIAPWNSDRSNSPDIVSSNSVVYVPLLQCSLPADMDHVIQFRRSPRVAGILERKRVKLKTS
jgi:hypothetical protein